MRTLLLIAVSTVIGAAAEPAAAASTLELVTSTREVDAVRDGQRGPAFLEFPVYAVPPAGMAFELHVRRPSLESPIEVTEVLRAADGSATTRELPAGLVKDFRAGGLPRFFRLQFRNTRGRTVLRRRAGFCPGGVLRERVAPDAPEEPVYPDGCGTWRKGNPFIRSQVWGIERGWATPALSFEDTMLDLPNGTYRARLSVSPRYREVFDIPAEQATASLRVNVRRGHPEIPLPVPRASTPAALGGGSAAALQPSGAQTSAPDADTVPNLAALPAWGIRTSTDERGRDHLSFSATAWNAGPAQLAVDGFRRPGEGLMDAYQSFYRGGERVGYQRVGSFEFDDRDGHAHWHFTDFATYNLLDAAGRRVVRSGKEAFCLAPTDAQDLLAPGATWRPDYLGFGRCGTRGSLALSQRLPAGWGDTYDQSLPGQSFRIGGLPNGRYQIEVIVNPEGRLLEVTTDDNRAVRPVVLRGRPGHRRVTVPPYRGIRG